MEVCEQMLVILSAALGIKLKALQMLGKCSTTALHPHSSLDRCLQFAQDSLISVAQESVQLTILLPLLLRHQDNTAHQILTMWQKCIVEMQSHRCLFRSQNLESA